MSKEKLRPKSDAQPDAVGLTPVRSDDAIPINPDRGRMTPAQFVEQKLRAVLRRDKPIKVFATPKRKTPTAPIVPQMTVLIDPGDAPEELITQLYVALSSLYRAYGGSGLKIAKDERRSFAGEVVG